MDPVSLIVGALAAGVTQGLAETAGDSVAKAYRKLRSLVARRFAGNQTAEVALAEHESDPETWQAPLARAVENTGASGDESVLEAAQALMALLDEAGTAAGKYNVTISDSQGVQVGDGNRQSNVFKPGT